MGKDSNEVAGTSAFPSATWERGKRNPYGINGIGPDLRDFFWGIGRGRRRSNSRIFQISKLRPEGFGGRCRKGGGRQLGLINAGDEWDYDGNRKLIRVETAGISIPTDRLAHA